VYRVRPNDGCPSELLDKIGVVKQPGRERRLLSFWPLQIGAWVLYSLASAISYIPFRHMRGYVIYKAALLFTTFLASLLVHAWCRFVWQKSLRLTPAVACSVVLTYSLGVICTASSAKVSLHFDTPKVALDWSMVAAEAFEPTIVLIAWSALYYGIKYYGTAEEQKKSAAGIRSHGSRSTTAGPSLSVATTLPVQYSQRHLYACGQQTT
jgi:hypothetical protein